MRRYNRFYHVVGIVRSLQLCVALTLLSWSVSRFSPSSSSVAAIAALAYYVRVTTIFCGDIIRRIFLLFLCPHFVFFIGNAVIVTLLLHSAWDSGSDATSGSAELEPEDSSDFGPLVAQAEPETTPSSDEAEQSPTLKVKVRTRSADERKDTFEIRRSDMEPCPEKDIHDGTEAEARVNFLLMKTDEESLNGIEEIASSEEGAMIRLLSDTEPRLETENFDDRKVADPVVQERVRFRPSETELCRKTCWCRDYGEEVSTVKVGMKLRRSDTDLFQRTESQGDDVEDLSSEEFQKKVEAFIARHQRFMRQESLSVAF